MDATREDDAIADILLYVEQLCQSFIDRLVAVRHKQLIVQSVKQQSNADLDRPYLGRLQDIPVDPIFIMGDHRSGTTLLYQLLDATKRFNVVRAYHVIKYGEILYNFINQKEDESKAQIQRRLAAAGIHDRLIDGVQATPDLPEEYGFLLREGPRPQLDCNSLPRFLEACKKIQVVSNPEKPLLVKNPWDYLNFMFVKEMFPNARFVFIHRHPICVINSQIKAVRILYHSKSIYHALLDRSYERLWKKPARAAVIRMIFSPWFNLALQITLRHVRLASNYFLEHIPLLDQQEYINVKYEDLCINPSATIQRVLNFVGETADFHTIDSCYVQPREVVLLNEVKKHKYRIAKHLQSYFAYCGYAIEDPLK